MLNLPKLQSVVALVTSVGHPTVAFQTWWQSVVNAIEAQERQQDEQLAAIQELQTSQAEIIENLTQTVATLQETVERLNVAIIDIATAQQTADSVTLSNAISASYTAPSSVLTSVDTGTDATIIISNFMRIYDDGIKVNVTGGSLTGLNYGTSYSVYYDDTARTLTTPTFIATTIAADARHNVAAGRHFVGIVATPIIGGPDGSGGSFPPGGGELE